MSLIPADASNTEMVYYACAIGGTLFFLLRSLTMFFGGGGEHGDLGGNHGGDHSDADDVHGAADTEAAFNLISLTSVGAFFAMFGWSGLAASKQFELGNFTSLIIATVVGTAMMALIAYFYYGIRRLQSSGATFNVTDAVGLSAQVYSRIPERGVGKVHLTFNGILRELDARSSNGEEIESFVTVKVTGTSPQSGVIVERV